MNIYVCVIWVTKKSWWIEALLTVFLVEMKKRAKWDGNERQTFDADTKRTSRGFVIVDLSRMKPHSAPQIELNIRSKVEIVCAWSMGKMETEVNVSVKRLETVVIESKRRGMEWKNTQIQLKQTRFRIFFWEAWYRVKTEKWCQKKNHVQRWHNTWK